MQTNTSCPFHRAECNPVIAPETVTPSRPGFTVEGTFNAGVARYNGEVILLLRVAEKPVGSGDGILHVPVLKNQDGRWDIAIEKLRLDDPRYDFSDPRKVLDVAAQTYVYLTSISHLRLARSKNGVDFTVEKQPFIAPDCFYEGFGAEDSRITQIGDTYYINYTAVSKNGITTALAVTRDFVTVEKQGLIFTTENRDVTIFPEKIGGKYYALNRPVPRQIGTPQMWISSSPDLLHWGGHQLLLETGNFPWDCLKVGGGAPPLKTDKGWLVIYHAGDKNNTYQLGALLLDLEDPAKILAIAREPVLSPEAAYEVKGFFPNVTFTNGAYLEDGVVHLYYGGADRVMALATAPLEKILEQMEPWEGIRF